MKDLIERINRACERSTFCFLLIFFVCVLTVGVPTALTGLHASGDTFVYLAFGEELSEAFANGRFLPSWANDNAGYGSVGIRFYPPISFYTLAFLRSVSGSWPFALFSSTFLWMLIGCWGIFVFVREKASAQAGILAALLYAIVPFHVAEVFRFSLIGEFAAGAVLPFCFLYAVRICDREKWGDVVGFAVSCGFLILTHIPTTISATIILLVFIPLMLRRPLVQRVFRFVLSGFLSLLLTAFYWVKLITEVDSVAHNSDAYTSGFSDYNKWLFPMSIFPKERADYYLSLFRNLDVMIVMTISLFIPALIAIFYHYRIGKIDPKKFRLLLALIICSAIGFFMLSSASSFVWAEAPILYKIQFPWRWLAVLSVTGSIALAISGFELLQKGVAVKRLCLGCVLLLATSMTIYNVRQSYLRSNIISDSDIVEMLAIRNSQAGTTLEAWWPIWARSEALEMAERVYAFGREVSITKWDAEERAFSLDEGPPATVRIATFYYPHWKASVNGKPVEIGHDDGGTITFPVDGNVSQVDLKFEEPITTYVTLLLSGIIGVFMTLVLGRSAYRSCRSLIDTQADVSKSS